MNAKASFTQAYSDPVSEPRKPDWAAVGQLCAAVPLPSLLGFLDKELRGVVDGLDMWLWDHQRTSMQSLLTEEIVMLRSYDDRFGSDTPAAAIVHQGDELGLLTAEPPGDLPGSVESGRAWQALRTLAPLLATALRANEGTVDTITLARRRKRMALPAEIQWDLLPPERLVARDVALSAAVEPAYETGGDVFDYSLDNLVLRVAVLDAVGHGLRAAMLSALAVAAMRRARRSGATLTEIVDDVGSAIAALGEPREFVTGVLVELDLVTGRGSWISAGHAPPLKISNGTIETLPLSPALPMGMVIHGEVSSPEPKEFRLEPGEALVLYSDGVVENAMLDDHRPVGTKRLSDSLLQHLGETDGQQTPSLHTARRVIDDLLSLTGAMLRDDATLVIVERQRSPQE